MKRKLLVVFFVLVLVFSVSGTHNAYAQAYTTSFSTAVDYQNVGTADTTTLHLLFYATPSTTSPIDITLPNLAQGNATEVLISSLSGITAPFQGSAVMESRPADCCHLGSASPEFNNGLWPSPVKWNR